MQVQYTQEGDVKVYDESGKPIQGDPSRDERAEERDERREEDVLADLNEVLPE